MLYSLLLVSAAAAAATAAVVVVDVVVISLVFPSINPNCVIGESDRV